MNGVQVRGQWNQFRGTCKMGWCGLTGNSIGRFNGRLLRMFGGAQVTYGHAKSAFGQLKKAVRH